MAKKPNNNSNSGSNGTDDDKFKTVKTGFDGKQRAVKLKQKGDSEFLVTKLHLNSPYSETFKSAEEAEAAFDHQIICTQN